jgi:Protein of unknown function (DUF551)
MQSSALRRTPRRVAAGPRWRGIATAPRDGTPVLTFHPDGGAPRIALAQWRFGGWFDFWAESGPAIDAEPSHWMPLPAPPG